VPHLEDAYDHLGHAVARAPYTVLLISLVVVAACAGGLPLLKTELDYEASWIPQKSKAWADRTRLRETFGSTAVSEVFMAHAPLLATAADIEASQMLDSLIESRNLTAIDA